MENAAETLTPDERNAMRAFLQRAEVRLSTLHRVAVAFVSGAGLLILLPVFFKEELVALIRQLLAHTSDFTATGGLGIAGEVLLYACILYPFILSLCIPLYALYLLLKDVVHFYFTIYLPGFSSDLVTPTFALSGITFSPDESPTAKHKILEYQYSYSGAINFAIPFSREKRREYFDATIESTNGEIIPETRRWDAIKDHIQPGTDEQTANHFSAAFGLARSLDRALIEEVATSEISLVRHIIYLRRLVLRYIKALLMFIWTSLVTFVMLPFLEQDQFPFFIIVSVGYLIWSLFVMRVVRMPLGWIYRHLKGIPDEKHIDKQLVILEDQLRLFCRVAVATSAVAVALSVLMYVS